MVVVDISHSAPYAKVVRTCLFELRIYEPKQFSYLYMAKLTSFLKVKNLLTEGGVLAQKTTRESHIWFTIFLVVMLGGAVRKWFTTSGIIGNVILLVQIVLPFLMYALSSAKTNNPLGNSRILSFYVFFLIIQVFNPLQYTIFHGVLGILVHGMFWVGMFFYFANRDFFTLDKYITSIILLVVGQVALAFIQYGLPTTHVLNKYAHESVNQIAVIADRVRVTGTFSYLSGYTAFLLFYAFFIWALIFKRVAPWLIFSLMLAGLAASFMTGSRSGVLLYLIFIGFALYENYKLREIAPLIFKLSIPLLVIFTIFLASKSNELLGQVETAYTNFYERTTGLQKVGEQNRRLTGDFGYFKGDRFKYPVFGIGTGATYQGATILFGVSPYVQEFGYAEAEFVKIVLEGGFVLIILKALLAAVLVSKLCFGSKLFKIVLWVGLVYGIPMVFNVHNASFLMLGLIYVDSAAWQALRARQREVSLISSPNLIEETIPLSTPTPALFPGYPQMHDKPSH